MTQNRQLATCPQRDDGGRIEDVCPIVNGNAEEQAALRSATAAGRQMDAQRQARQRRRRQRRTLRDIGYISAGAGAVLVGMTIADMCPWWISVAAILAAQAMFYAARRM